MRARAKDYAEAIFAVVGADIAAVERAVKALVKLLSRRNQLALLPAIITEVEIISAPAGEVRLKLALAKPLDKKGKETLSRALNLAPGQIVWDETVDPALGAGAKINFGDYQIDTTVKARLNALYEKLVG
ncbi:hypothetical protein EPN90_00680 [Patescibacteria group bacterium]|nr:MAG: hypothetical protein EPN90_00680 [Patescibacteria group bacterium]